MAKLSISMPDDLADDLRGLASGNVSAFVVAAVRHELDRRRLHGFLDELEDELGPADENEVALFAEALTPAQAALSPRRRPSRARQRSVS